MTSISGLSCLIVVAALGPATKVPLQRGSSSVTFHVSLFRRSARQRVKNAGVKEISSDGLICHDSFILLKTLAGAPTVRKYACYRGFLFSRQPSYQRCVFWKRLRMICVLKDPLSETVIEASVALRRVFILTGIHRRTDCVITVFIKRQ